MCFFWSIQPHRFHGSWLFVTVFLGPCLFHLEPVDVQRECGSIGASMLYGENLNKERWETRRSQQINLLPFFSLADDFKTQYLHMAFLERSHDIGQLIHYVLNKAMVSLVFAFSPFLTDFFSLILASLGLYSPLKYQHKSFTSGSVFFRELRLWKWISGLALKSKLSR